LPSSNSDLQNQVVKAFISRLEHDLGVTADNDVNNIIVSNIKDLITSVTKYGRNDREQIRFKFPIRFKEIIAVAVSGKNSLIKVMGATGLSRRNLDKGKKMRTEFEIETQKAMSEKSIQNEENNDIETAENTDDDDEADSDVDSDREEDGEDHEDEDGSPSEVLPNKKRAANGQGIKLLKSKNRYRFLLSKTRKVRKDNLPRGPIQRFCHYSPWGGRVDTCKLAKQPVIVEQPEGGFEYEPMRSYQFTVKEMYSQFKESEYGAELRTSKMGEIYLWGDFGRSFVHA
jgi:hypothetical protein